MKRIALLVIAVSLVAVPTAVAKKAPSFALWTAKWKAQTDAQQNKLKDACLKVYGETADRKVGECFVKGMRPLLRQEAPLWEKQVAGISRGQTAPCRKAIHAYWLASRKAQAASLIYLDSHQHVSVTDIAKDLNEDPYATLKAQTDATKKRAIQVCG
jgi:hypothetical protein